MAVSISKGEREFIEGGIRQSIREDGRSLLVYRPITLETGFIPQANGSARVKISATDVLVGVKVEIGAPHPSSPSEGRLEIKAEYISTASPLYLDKEYAEQQAAELNSVLRTMISSKKSLDTSKLGIIPGHQCWVVYVDCMIMEVDGNVLDTAALAISAALQTTKVPVIEVVAGDGPGGKDIEVSDDPYNTIPLPLTSVPVVVTFGRVGNSYIVDASPTEEACTKAKVSFAINADGELCALQKSGLGGFGIGHFHSLVKEAPRLARHLQDQLSATLSTERKLEEHVPLGNVSASKVGFMT